MLAVWVRDKFYLLINKDTETSEYSVEMSDSVFHTYRYFLTRARVGTFKLWASSQCGSRFVTIGSPCNTTSFWWSYEVFLTFELLKTDHIRII